MKICKQGPEREIWVFHISESGPTCHNCLEQCFSTSPERTGENNLYPSPSHQGLMLFSEIHNGTIIQIPSNISSPEAKPVFKS